MADAHTPFADLAAVAQRDGAAVLVTVAAARGSVPRDAGTTMVVGRETVVGTIGGGHLEYEAIRLSRGALGHDAAPPPWVVRFPLAARLGQCCGGVVTLAFEVVDPGAPWLAALTRAEHDGTRCALVSCLGRPGHLLVTPDGVEGTLGDAALDARVTDIVAEVSTTQAHAALVEVAPWERALSAEPLSDSLTNFPSAAPSVDIDQPANAASSTPAADAFAAQRTRPCEGITLLVRTPTVHALHVLVFGNGHVGRALVRMLAAVPARVRWIDARESDFPATVPEGVEVVATDIPEAELAHAPAGACVLIATHDHALDLTLVTAALSRDDWTYLGLIGSRSKRQQFEHRLLARGFTSGELARIVCPIGRSEVQSLSGKEPGTIALATAAEIVAAHERARAAQRDDGAGAVQHETRDRAPASST